MRNFSRCERGHTKIVVSYGVTKNRAPSGGYCPVVRVNRQPWQGNTYCRGRDNDRAVAEARSMAQDEGSRYRGDYCVAVRRVHKVRGKGL